MTTSRNNTIMSWMAYTDFLSRLRIAAGILLPLNTRTLLLYPGGRDCIGAAGVDAYHFSFFHLIPHKRWNGKRPGTLRCRAFQQFLFEFTFVCVEAVFS